jgi:hypothetical protein
MHIKSVYKVYLFIPISLEFVIGILSVTVICLAAGRRTEITFLVETRISHHHVPTGSEANPAFYAIGAQDSFLGD